MRCESRQESTQRTATDALVGHLHAAAPWGARITVTERGGGEAFRTSTSGVAYQTMAAALETAYATATETAGVGGGIPLCDTLTNLYPNAEILIIGLNEPAAHIHAVDESVSAYELERMTIAEATFVQRYARQTVAGHRDQR